MTPSARSVSAAVFLAALAAPIAWAATTQPSWIDEEYRRCVGDAVEEEMNRRVDAQRDYGDEQIRELETYRDALSRAWDIADEDERRDAIRDADRAYRDAGRESKRTYDAEVRDARNDSRQAQRDCRDRQNDNEDFTDDMCLSSADCRSNQYCTTETGTCDPSCPPDVQSCAQVCAGTCERSSSSRSSRSPSSSRSSNGGSSSSRGAPGPGTNCEPYRCPDGREFPSCSADGYPINYFQNPCYS
jgi:hypothetical protein